MSVKKLMKITKEISPGNQDLEILKMKMHDESYFKSREYAQLANISSLKKVLDGIDVNTQEKLLKDYVLLGEKMDKNNEKLLKIFVVLLLVVLGMDIFVAVYWKKNPFMIGLLLQMMLTFLMLSLSDMLNKKDVESRSKLEDELRGVSERHFSVKDENGDKVKAIWFLYNNLDFESEMEKEVFLLKNYEKYNHCFAKEFLDSSKNVLKDNYLDCLLNKKNEELRELRKFNSELTTNEPDKVQVLL